MAEIHVEKKRGVGNWVWLLLLVLLIVAAVAYLWYAGYIGGASNSIGRETSMMLEAVGGYNGA